MKIIKPSHEILTTQEEINILKKRIEVAGRTCYKSENKITDDSADEFINKIYSSGHNSVLEHANITVKFICDRGVSHELVRHRLMAISQESTRYCRYSDDKFGRELNFIKPCFWNEDSPEYRLWFKSMECAELIYMNLLNSGSTAQQARSVLPNSLKTELVVTANLREWLHIMNLRCAKCSSTNERINASIITTFS